jgi:hypothetical protein
MKKTSGYFHIVLALAKMSIANLINLAFGLIYDTDPDYTVHSYTQAQLRALATTVQNELGSRVTDPHPTLTHQEQIDVLALTQAILAIKSEVTVAANKKAQGNRATFEIVVNRIGLHPAKAHATHVRIFEEKVAGKGMLEFIGPIEKGLGMPTYTFEYGIAPSFGVLPTVWQPQIALHSSELYMTGLPSGSVVALRYAVTIIPSHHKKTASTGAATQKTVTQTAALNKMVRLLPVNKQGNVQLVHGVAYTHFSDAVYIVVS